MPVAPLRQCATPGCRTLTAGRLCPDCQPAPIDGRHGWDTARRPVARVRGRQLQARRAALFTREPLCRACAAHGRTALATVRDHIVPLAEGGIDDEINVQPLCQDCSDLKTREESRRGQRRDISKS